MARPTGEYVDQMLDPGGWPDVDEGILYERARVFAQAFRQVTEVLETCLQQQAQVFDGGIWVGGAADAANGELAANVDGLTSLQHGIATVTTWHEHVAQVVEQAKSTITDNLEAAHQRVAIVQNDPTLDATERETAVNALVTATHGANVSLVTATAEQILASKTWRPPDTALQELLDRKTPPPYTPPAGTPSAGTPSTGTPSVGTPSATPRPEPAPPAPNPVPTEKSPPTGVPGAVAPSPATGTPPAPTRPPGPPASPSFSPTSPPRTATPSSPEVPGATPSAPAAPLAPAASTVPPSDAGGRNNRVAPASVTSPSLGSIGRDDPSPSVAPAAATGSPPAALPPAVAGGAPAARGGAGPGPNVRPSAPPERRPLGAAPTPKPAAPTTNATARTAPKLPDRNQPPDVAAMALIPVSVARAERDAVAAATTADAARRRGGPDPLRMARLVAAALNAPSAGGRDYGFFWVTAVTTDGAIVVANSYGLAYIPEGVQLPEPVHMATADDAIPVIERTRWATHPVSAVQGWATHHETGLRAVIATEEQFANSDPGAAKIVLKPDDIPDRGDMPGRSRLAVVDPHAAEQLSTMHETRLTDLLPPASVDVVPRADGPRTLDPETQAKLDEMLAGDFDPARLFELVPPEQHGGDTPSTDRRAALWLEVVKPMTSNADGRESAHLRAFHAYAAHAGEIAVSEAHNAVDPQAQRAAVADYLYWKYLTGLFAAVLTNAP